MDLKKLLSQHATIVYQQDDDGVVLQVKETAQYRWFEYGGASTQSLMNKAQPEQVLMPVYQALLLFLFFKRPAHKVLNLGLGGASIERCLATIPDLLLTSVDASPIVIDMAKRYFNLPENIDVLCQPAEQFIFQTNTVYDVVLCDLFIGEQNPAFLFIEPFYAQLSKITASNAVLMINLQADTDEQLLHALLAIKKYFPYIVLVEFNDYKNIVVIGSCHEIPTRAFLLTNLADSSLVDFSAFFNSSLQQAIEKMRYLAPSI